MNRNEAEASHECSRASPRRRTIYLGGLRTHQTPMSGASFSLRKRRLADDAPGPLRLKHSLKQQSGTRNTLAPAHSGATLRYRAQDASSLVRWAPKEDPAWIMDPTFSSPLSPQHRLWVVLLITANACGTCAAQIYRVESHMSKLLK